MRDSSQEELSLIWTLASGRKSKIFADRTQSDLGSKMILQIRELY